MSAIEKLVTGRAEIVIMESGKLTYFSQTAMVEWKGLIPPLLIHNNVYLAIYICKDKSSGNRVFAPEP